MANIKANIDTEVNVKPAKSQVVLVALIITSTICYVAGFMFLWYKPDISWVPLTIASLILFAVYRAWNRSQNDIDLAGSAPTQFTDAVGNSITTDTRALSSPQVVQNIEHLFSGLCHREPLPNPNGLVDNDGNPVPGSEEEAIERVRKVNETAQVITDAVAASFNENNREATYQQPNIDEPQSEILITTNASKSQA